MAKGKNFSAAAAKQVQRNQTEAKGETDRFKAAMQALGADPVAESKAKLPLAAIKDRAKNIRAVDTAQGIERAVAIAEHGLLQNLVVDEDHVLIAGAHRKWALALLQEVSGNPSYARKKLQEFLRPAPFSSPPSDTQRKHSERHLDEQAKTLAAGWVKHSFHEGIEVKVLAFSSQRDPRRAVVSEIVENTGRSNLSKANVKSAWDRLIEVGFVEVKGRPKTGELPIWPAMELMFGAYRTTLQQLLEADGDAPKPKRLELAPLESRVRDSLAKSLQLKVAVKPKGDGKGAVVLSYGNSGELERILAALKASDAQA